MENYIYHYTIFGQVSDPNAYGGGAYQSGVYGEDSTQTGTDPSANPTSPSGNGELANTGFDIVLPLAIGATMIVGSVIALVKMRKSKKIQQQ